MNDFNKSNNKKNKEKKTKHDKPTPMINTGIHLSESLDTNLNNIKDIFTQDTYLVSGKIKVSKDIKIGIVFYDGMVDSNRVFQHIVKPIHQKKEFLMNNLNPSDKWTEILNDYILNVTAGRVLEDFDDIVLTIISGQTCVFLEGSKKALIIDTTQYAMRSLGKPEMEATIYGSQESFTEDLKTNIILIRRKLKSLQLKFKKYVLGTYSYTEVRVLYIEGIAKKEIVDEVCRRIENISVDHIYDSSEIAQLIDDNPVMILPQHKVTERSDKVVSCLLEGQIAILSDGFPTAVIVPYFLSQEFKTVDDYGDSPLIGSILRFTRYIGIIISLLSTSLYLALVTYNHSIFPPDLALRISSGREWVPFPSYIEVLVMTFAIDLLKEIGIRLPKGLGSTVSILGALVIGQAAVEAGYISPSLIIIIAISAFSMFLVPSIALGQVIRGINYVLIILTSFLGLYGLLMGIVFFVWLLMKESSFNIPIGYPFGTGKISDLKDTLFRAPLWHLKDRTDVLVNENKRRMGSTVQNPQKRSSHNARK